MQKISSLFYNANVFKNIIFLNDKSNFFVIEIMNAAID